MDRQGETALSELSAEGWKISGPYPKRQIMGDAVRFYYALALHKRSGDDGLADRPGPLANRQEIHSSALPISTSTVVQKSGLAAGPLGDDLLRRLWLHRRTAGTRHTRGKLGLRLELDLIAGNLARVGRPYLIPHHFTDNHK